MSIASKLQKLQIRLDSDDELIQVSKIKLVQLLSEAGISKETTSSQDPPKKSSNFGINHS